MIFIILIFGNVPDILLQHYSRSYYSFNYHQRNVRSRVSVSVSNFQVSVSAVMTKCRSWSRLEIWTRSRSWSRRLRSRLHHCLLLYLTSTYVFKNFGGAIARLSPLWLRAWLQLPVTIKRSFLSSHKWKKLFEWYRQLRLLPKQILCQVISCFK